MKTNYKLHLSAGKDALRPVMQHILLTKKEFVATDAHIMSVVPNGYILDEDSIALIPDEGLLIDAKVWKTIYNANRISLTLEDNKYFIQAMFTNKPFMVFEVFKDGQLYNFPKWEQVLPNESASQEVPAIGLDSKLLYNLGQALDIPSFKLEFNGQNRPIMCKSLSDSDNAYGIIMPIKIY